VISGPDASKLLMSDRPDKLLDGRAGALMSSAMRRVLSGIHGAIVDAIAAYGAYMLANSASWGMLSREPTGCYFDRAGSGVIVEL
jgi:hypothetical protein